MVHGGIELGCQQPFSDFDNPRGGKVATAIAILTIQRSLDLVQLLLIRRRFLRWEAATTVLSVRHPGKIS